MSEETKIEWCDSTFNPWIGCMKVGPGCDNCYAARSTPARTKRVVWGAGQPRRRTAPSTWRKPMLWEREHEAFALMHDRRRRVFCASLADVFDNEVPTAWRAELFALIAATPHLDWLLLTKRIGNVAKMIEAPGMQKCGLPDNVWLGATVVNQAEADRDVPKLLAVPARVRFLSIEPMLGPIDARRYLAKQCDAGSLLINAGTAGVTCPRCDGNARSGEGCSGIDWIIAGGESGPSARSAHPEWFRSLRDQCAAADVPFLLKQWGEWLPISQMSDCITNRLYESRRVAKLHQDQGALDESYRRDCAVPYGVVHADGSFHEPLEPLAFLQVVSPMTTFKVGKKAAGRLLDGVEHNAFPRPL